MTEQAMDTAVPPAEGQVAALPYSTDDFRREIKRAKRARRLAVALVALAVVLAAAVVAAVVVLGVPGSLQTMPSDDMAPLVAKGDTVILDRNAKPSDGDVILFRDTGGELQAKRIVAVAGEWVNVSSDGTVAVGPTSLEGASMAGVLDDGSVIIAARQVPDGACFAMADNEKSAVEALYQSGNYVADSQVVGVVRYRTWPPAAIGSAG